MPRRSPDTLQPEFEFLKEIKGHQWVLRGEDIEMLKTLATSPLSNEVLTKQYCPSGRVASFIMRLERLGNRIKQIHKLAGKPEPTAFQNHDGYKPIRRRLALYAVELGLVAQEELSAAALEFVPKGKYDESVLGCILDRLAFKEICDKLDIPPNTASGSVKRLAKRFGIEKDTGLQKTKWFNKLQVFFGVDPTHGIIKPSMLIELIKEGCTSEQQIALTVGASVVAVHKHLERLAKSLGIMKGPWLTGLQICLNGMATSYGCVEVTERTHAAQRAAQRKESELVLV